ncbi:MAG: M56 family metallopeptidase [Planctomycetes bacterium]|nr:M56 family metallopeptidase [Planctomycetota bacterium]
MSALAVTSRLAELLRHSGLELLAGTTAVLAGFALLVLASRSSTTRHRLAGASMLAIGSYLLIALLPLPRLTSLRFDAGPTNVATPPAAVAMPLEQPATAPLSLQEPAHTFIFPVAAPEEHAAIAPSTAPALAATETTATIASDPVSWLAVAAITVATTFAALLLLGWLRLRHILRRSRPAARATAELIELPKGTRVRIADRPLPPFCCGLLRPTIVLPPHLSQPSDETRFVLLHERAHLRAGDVRRRMLAACLRPLLFWHPLFWWLTRQLRFHGELLADREAAGQSVGDYVRCMVGLVDRSPIPALAVPTGPTVATVFHRRSELTRRLEMMLQRPDAQERLPSPRRRRLGGLFAAAAVTLCAATFGVAQEPTQEPEPTREEVRELREEVVHLRKLAQDLMDGMVKLREQHAAEKGEQPLAAPVKATGGRATSDARANQATEETVAKQHAALLPKAGEDRQRASQNITLTSDIDLVTRCIELCGEVDIKKIELANLRKLEEQSVVSAQEVEIASIKLRTKQQQYDAVRGMVESALEQAKVDCSHTKKLRDKGFVSNQELARAEGRLRLLERALK